MGKKQVFYVTHKQDAWQKVPPERWAQAGFWRQISRVKDDWPTRGDILLIYKFPARLPDAGIREIYRLDEVTSEMVREWGDRFGLPDPSRPPEFAWQVRQMTLVARLARPITYKQMGTQPAVQQWGRWRASFRGLINDCGLVPEPVWDALRVLIVERNPGAAGLLDRVGV